MRLLAVLLLVSSIALNTFAEPIQFSQETHPNYYEDVPEVIQFAKRSKRSAAFIPSILAAVGIAAQCEPGWTGQFCENPLCNASNILPSVTNWSNRLIDTLYLPSGCTGKYYIPVDAMSAALNIRVNADGFPWINLTDSSGNLVSGSIGVASNYGYASYPATLPPGAYSLSIDNGGIATQSCIVTVEIISSLAIATGFTMSPQSDQLPEQEFGIDSTPMYFVSHVVNITTPGQVRAVTIRNQETVAPIYRSALTSRYGCSHEWYAGQFSCSGTQRYIAHVDGIDQYGYPWRRSVIFGCLYPPSTTTAIPTTTPPLVCYNGGTLLNANTPSASCFCPELFSGVQCEFPACMNGGYLAPNGLQCVCPDGWFGDNCQHIDCVPNFGQYLTDQRTLIVVVRNVQSMNPYTDAIINAVQQEVNGTGGDIYQSFMLVRYGNDFLPLDKYYSQAEYQSFLRDLAKISNSTMVGNCSDVIFDAMTTVFLQQVSEKSSILHFTDAIASDASGWRGVSEANSRRNLPIYNFFFPQSSCNFDPLSEGYRALQNAAMFSGGLTLLENAPNTFQLQQQIINVMHATASKMNLVYANDLDRCVPNVQRSFMIDSSAQSIIILATGEQLLLTMSDPDQTRNLYDIYSDGQNYIWEAISTKVGEYVFSISAANQQNPCSIRIMSKSDFDFYFATTFYVGFDAIDSVPVVGTPLPIVAQLNGLYNATKDPFRLFSELTIFTNRNKENNLAGKPMYYSNGLYRDGCGYHLYFGVADFCEFDNQPFYATIFADDNNGFTIQRAAVGFCSITNTTTNPPGTCLNGGVLDPTNNSTCICQVGFVGQYCQNIVCQNGGTPAGSFCICNGGSAGTFCELYTCPSINIPNLSFDGQTMTFVVATRPSMQDTWNQLSAGIAEFVRDCQTHSSYWIKTWVLITVTGNDYDLIISNSSASLFVNAVQTIAANLSAYSYSGNDNCSVEIMQGLLLGTYYSEKRSSIYLFTDATGPDDLSAYPQLFSLVTENQITVNIIQTAVEICTSNGVLPDYIQELAYMNSGFFYMSPSVGKILPYITAQYKSGVSGAISWNDCATAPAMGYIAVDSQTQAVTLAAIGENITKIEVTLPDGTDVSQSWYEVQLVSEPNLYLRQYMAACDLGSGWQYYQQVCCSFGFSKLSWTDASKYCHNQDGALVDVTNQDKQNFVHFQTQGIGNWIGLIRHGDSWTWDVPGDNTAQPLDPSFAPWCAGYPTADTNMNCVWMDATGCWQNANCSETKLYSCQKHRYGAGFYPTDPGSNDVMPGRWQFKVYSGSGSCYAQIRSQSDIQIFQGFTNDPTNDFPLLYANAGSNTNYIAAAPTGISAFQQDGVYNTMDGNLNYALIGYNNSLTNPLTMSNRPFCGYSYISQPFSCPQTGAYTNFFVKYSGIDQHGYAFNRYLDATCANWVTQCFNGGFLYNGACVCQPGWAGDRCVTPICQNGGVADGDACKCPPMYGGTFCDLPYCEPPYPAKFGDKQRTFAILLETSYGMGSTIWLMQKNLKAALDSIKNDPTTAGWFTEWVLYPFDSSSNKASWYAPVVSTNSDDIVAAVKNINISSCPGTGTCDTFCPRPYFQVLDDVLSMNSFASPNSVVLIVTRSTPEDATQKQDRVTQLLQETRAQINYILPAIDSPCGEGWNSPAVRQMYNSVQYSDGNLFVMAPGDVCGNFIQQYVPSMFKSGGLESRAFQPCQDADVLFQVEHEMYEFTIDYYMPVTNPPFVLTLTDPAGDIILLPPSLITSDSNYLGVVKVNDTGATRAGTYKLTISGGSQANYCNLNIKGRSSIEIYPGFVSSNDGHQGAINDKAHYAPVLLEMNTIVVHADGLDAANGVLQYAQFIDVGYGVGLYHTTALKRRDSGCSYEWYGTVPLDWQYSSSLVIIYGRDGRGANFHRNFYVTGVSDRPTPLPPPATCDLTAVQQDIIFMIDSSVKNDQSTFQALKSFASTVMSPYKLTPTLTQAAALTVADQAYGGFSFLAATSWNLWDKYVTALAYSNQPGQNTASGFNYIIANYTSSSQGYRATNTVRHTVIYLTNTNPTDADAAQVPYSIRRSGTFGIAVVGLNMTLTDQLRAIAPADGCIYIAPTVGDLNTYGLNFVRQFSCYRQPICGM